MTSGQDSARVRASQEATDWFILLQDDPGDGDLRRRFGLWLADPVNKEAWAVTERTTSGIAAVPPAHRELWEPHAPARWCRAVPRLALGVAAVACLAVFFGPGALIRVRADYVTGAGQTRRVALADGSSIEIAPESALSVAYGDKERRVALLAGEAFFTVAHEPGRPFRVAAGTIETTDIGTAFDIRRGEAGAEIAVREGSVRVDNAGAPEPVPKTLTAGQSLRESWTGEARRSDQPPSQIAAWRQNQLVAQDLALGEAVDRLRPYFRGSIIMADAALAARPVTGVYNLADPVEALRGIAGAHGATVRRITPWILLVSASG